VTVLALGIEKGGVGKTTLCHHLAAYAAKKGLRTLAVDLDPQASLTYIITGNKGDTRGFWTAMIQQVEIERVAYEVDGYDGQLHLLPGGKSTGDVRNILSVRGSKLTALRTFMARARAHYDLVVIDTPPSPAMDYETEDVLDALVAPALYAADYILAPVIPEELSLLGLAALSATLDILHKEGGSVALLGVVPMMYDARTKEHAMNFLELERTYKELTYPVVHKAVAVSRCAVYGLPVWDFEPRNPVSQQMMAVMERAIQDVEEKTPA
jgi:chromosome partitioning protein